MSGEKLYDVRTSEIKKLDEDSPQGDESSKATTSSFDGTVKGLAELVKQAYG
jgi:hypothetical protein